jgi:hypothetical protein
MTLSGIAKGLLAGAAGTAAMTAHQSIRERLARRSSEPDQNNEPPGREDGDPWESAPAPAQAGKRLIDAVSDRPVSPDAIPLFTQVMHWSYGSSWGVGYALARNRLDLSARLLGPTFGIGVWIMSYAQLVPLGIYDPPWSYPLGSVADELAYHVTYGAAVALAHRVLPS